MKSGANEQLIKVRGDSELICKENKSLIALAYYPPSKFRLEKKEFNIPTILLWYKLLVSVSWVQSDSLIIDSSGHHILPQKGCHRTWAKFSSDFVRCLCVIYSSVFASCAGVV